MVAVLAFVGGHIKDIHSFKPSEKYDFDSWDDDIPNRSKVTTSHDSNHQAVLDYFAIQTSGQVSIHVYTCEDRHCHV